MSRILLTIIGIWTWSIIWIALEYVIYGYPENRLVDNIMTLLLIPLIYRSTKPDNSNTKSDEKKWTMLEQYRYERNHSKFFSFFSNTSDFAFYLSKRNYEKEWELECKYIGYTEELDEHTRFSAKTEKEALKKGKNKIVESLSYKLQSVFKECFSIAKELELEDSFLKQLSLYGIQYDNDKLDRKK